MKTCKKTTDRASTIAMGAVAAALAGALSLGTAMPALADEQAPAPAQQPASAEEVSADEGAWDAGAAEDGFAADAGAYAGQLGSDANQLGSDANGYADANGYGHGGDNGWWWRRVSPRDALDSAEDYFGVYGYDSWDYQVGRFRGTPAYRIQIDADDEWQPWGSWYGTTRYVAFVNYFTGRVMAGYVDYE